MESHLYWNALRLEPPKGFALIIRSGEDLAVIEASTQEGLFWLSGYRGRSAYFYKDPLPGWQLAAKARESVSFVSNLYREEAMIAQGPVDMPWVKRALPAPAHLFATVERTKHRVHPESGRRTGLEYSLSKWYVI